MEVDKINPAGGYVLSNVRPLCPACNWERKDALYTDVVVRAKMVKRWEREFAAKDLWWLRRNETLGGETGV